MSQFELVVVLLVAAIPLVSLARRASVGYPVLLVLGGLAVGFVPGVPTIEIPPDLILVIFLPPLLFWQAVSSPFRAFRVFATPIVRLAIGLVAITAVLVAIVAHALVPGLPWAAAFVLGAVVGPTDEVAFVPIAERLGLPTRIVAVIQGESLLNDAVALVIFAAAVQWTVTGRFSWSAVLLHFAWTAVGSLGIGVVVGIAVVRITDRMRDPMLAALLALLSGLSRVHSGEPSRAFGRARNARSRAHRRALRLRERAATFARAQSGRLGCVALRAQHGHLHFGRRPAAPDRRGAPRHRLAVARARRARRQRRRVLRARGVDDGHRLPDRSIRPHVRGRAAVALLWP